MTKFATPSVQNFQEKPVKKNATTSSSTNQQGNPGLDSSQAVKFNEPGWGDTRTRAYSSSQPEVARGNNQPSQMIQRATEEKASALESGLRGNLENYFGTSLGGVRVSNGSASRQAADKMGAYAYTYGQTIHLGSAALKLNEPRKNALLAHEVTHTIQQKGASPGVQPESLEKSTGNNQYEAEASKAAAEFSFSQWSGSRLRAQVRPTPLASKMPQPADLTTDWGEFIVADYRSLKYISQRSGDVPEGSTREMGVQIQLEFKPGEKVDSKKIGLVQTRNDIIDGSVMEEGAREFHQAKKGNGIGVSIDVFEGTSNPMYQAGYEEEKPGGKLGDAKGMPIRQLTTVGVGAQKSEVKAYEDSYFVEGRDRIGTEWGHYYFDGAGKRSDRVNATLVDSPHGQSLGPNNSQIFETAALCVEGNLVNPKNPTQDGLYYGSIEWGWKRDAAGKFSKIDPVIKSKGVPSINFLTAAKLWNDGKADVRYMAKGGEIPVFTTSGNKVIASTRPPKLLPGMIITPSKTFDVVSVGDGILLQPVDIEDYYTSYILLSDFEDRNKFVKQAAGKETLNIPMPTYTVGKLKVEIKPAEGKSKKLSSGTRLERLSGGIFQVANGPHAGLKGTIEDVTGLTQDELGTL